MRPMRILPALLLAVALTGCGGDEESKDSDPPSPTQDALAAQAEAILECTTARELPGSIGLAKGGVPAIDLTTENETIVVHLLETDEDAAAYQSAADLDQQQVGNAVILGGAITPEHRTTIVECIEGG